MSTQRRPGTPRRGSARFGETGNNRIPFFTSFPVDENPISQGGRWRNGALNGTLWHNMQVLGGRFASTNLQASGADDDSVACLDPAWVQFNPNQTVRGTAFRTPGYTQQHELLLLLRFAITGSNARGYEVYWTTSGSGAVNLVRWNGGLHGFTPLATASGFATMPTTGDTMQASITGLVITVSFNGGASILTYDDTSAVGGSPIATGNPGMGNNPGIAPSTVDDMAWTAMYANNL